MHLVSGSPTVINPPITDRGEAVVDVSYSPQGNLFCVLTKLHLQFWAGLQHIVHLTTVPLPRCSLLPGRDVGAKVTWHQSGKLVAVTTVDRRVIFYEADINIADNAAAVCYRPDRRDFKIANGASRVAQGAEVQIDYGLLVSVVSTNQFLLVATSGGFLVALDWRAGSIKHVLSMSAVSQLINNRGAMSMGIASSSSSSSSSSQQQHHSSSASASASAVHKGAHHHHQQPTVVMVRGGGASASPHLYGGSNMAVNPSGNNNNQQAAQNIIVSTATGRPVGDGSSGGGVGEGGSNANNGTFGNSAASKFPSATSASASAAAASSLVRVKIRGTIADMSYASEGKLLALAFTDGQLLLLQLDVVGAEKGLMLRLAALPLRTPLSSGGVGANGGNVSNHPSTMQGNISSGGGGGVGIGGNGGAGGGMNYSSSNNSITPFSVSNAPSFDKVSVNGPKRLVAVGSHTDNAVRLYRLAPPPLSSAVVDVGVGGSSSRGGNQMVMISSPPPACNLPRGGASSSPASSLPLQPLIFVESSGQSPTDEPSDLRKMIGISWSVDGSTACCYYGHHGLALMDGGGGGVCTMTSFSRFSGCGGVGVKGVPSLFPGACASVTWGCADSRLIACDVITNSLLVFQMLRPCEASSVYSPPYVGDDNRSAVAAPAATLNCQSGGNNSSRAVALMGADCIALFRSASAAAAAAAGMDGGGGGGGVSDNWEHFTAPRHYLNSNYPLRFGAVSGCGEHVCVAGHRGLAIFSKSNRRWKTFQDIKLEKDIAVVGSPHWLNDLIVAVPVRRLSAQSFSVMLFARTSASALSSSSSSQTTSSSTALIASAAGIGVGGASNNSTTVPAASSSTAIINNTFSLGSTHTSAAFLDLSPSCLLAELPMKAKCLQMASAVRAVVAGGGGGSCITNNSSAQRIVLAMRDSYNHLIVAEIAVKAEVSGGDSRAGGGGLAAFMLMGMGGNAVGSAHSPTPAFRSLSVALTQVRSPIDLDAYGLYAPIKMEMIPSQGMMPPPQGSFERAPSIPPPPAGGMLRAGSVGAASAPPPSSSSLLFAPLPKLAILTAHQTLSFIDLGDAVIVPRTVVIGGSAQSVPVSNLIPTPQPAEHEHLSSSSHQQPTSPPTNNHCSPCTVFYSPQAPATVYNFWIDRHMVSSGGGRHGLSPTTLILYGPHGLFAMPLYSEYISPRAAAFVGGIGGGGPNGNTTKRRPSASLLFSTLASSSQAANPFSPFSGHAPLFLPQGVQLSELDCEAVPTFLLGEEGVVLAVSSVIDRALLMPSVYPPFGPAARPVLYQHVTLLRHYVERAALASGEEEGGGGVEKGGGPLTDDRTRRSTRNEEDTARKSHHHREAASIFPLLHALRRGSTLVETMDFLLFTVIHQQLDGLCGNLSISTTGMVSSNSVGSNIRGGTIDNNNNSMVFVPPHSVPPASMFFHHRCHQDHSTGTAMDNSDSSTATLFAHHHHRASSCDGDFASSCVLLESTADNRGGNVSLVTYDRQQLRSASPTSPFLSHFRGGGAVSPAPSSSFNIIHHHYAHGHRYGSPSAALMSASSAMNGSASSSSAALLQLHADANDCSDLGALVPPTIVTPSLGALLAELLTDLKAFPAEYATVATGCVRKVDSSKWGPIFRLIGAPYRFFNACLERGFVREAAQMLRVVLMDDTDVGGDDWENEEGDVDVDTDGHHPHQPQHTAGSNYSHSGHRMVSTTSAAAAAAVVPPAALSSRRSPSGGGQASAFPSFSAAAAEDIDDTKEALERTLVCAKRLFKAALSSPATSDVLLAFEVLRFMALLSMEIDLPPISPPEALPTSAIERAVRSLLTSVGMGGAGEGAPSPPPPAASTTDGDTSRFDAIPSPSAFLSPSSVFVDEDGVSRPEMAPILYNLLLKPSNADLCEAVICTAQQCLREGRVTLLFTMFDLFSLDVMHFIRMQWPLIGAEVKLKTIFDQLHVEFELPRGQREVDSLGVQKAMGRCPNLFLSPCPVLESPSSSCRSSSSSGSDGEDTSSASSEGQSSEASSSSSSSSARSSSPLNPSSPFILITPTQEHIANQPNTLAVLRALEKVFVPSSIGNGRPRKTKSRDEASRNAATEGEEVVCCAYIAALSIILPNPSRLAAVSLAARYDAPLSNHAHTQQAPAASIDSQILEMLSLPVNRGYVRLREARKALRVMVG